MTEQQQETLIDGLLAVQDLIDESKGVFGLHLNGDPCPWDELLLGGRHEGWLKDFDIAMELVVKLKSDQQDRLNEQARIQHEIKMTDDPIYREWYRKQQKAKEIDEHGINED